VGAERLLALSIRSYRVGGSHNDTIFGAPPRAIAFRNGSEANPSLDEALRETLSLSVPWLARPIDPKPIYR
jgi:hypothetical protein